MKNTQKSIKKTLLAGIVLLLLCGLTACDKNNKSNDPTNSNNNVGQIEKEEKEQFLPGSTMLTKEEVLEAVETGEVVFSDKDVENSLLDELDLEKGYRYYPEVYRDEACTDLVEIDKGMAYYFPEILDENDSRLKFKPSDQVYFKLVFSGEIRLLKSIEYVQKDDIWYKAHHMFVDENHVGGENMTIGHKVVNEEKIQELNNSKKH